MKNNKHFASDNNAGVHGKIMEAMIDANNGHVLSYGEDIYTQNAINKFKEIFGEDIEVYFVYNGTGANVLGLTAGTNTYNAVLCAETSHINVDECGAPEKFSGCKLIALPSKDGKITVPQLEKYLHASGNEHHSQPKIISITQATELGTIYTVEEIKKIAGFAHMHDMLLHMDGARIANAAVSLNVSIKEITKSAGVDILSFGGTKNGMMFGEAIIFFDKTVSSGFKYIRKQGMQLASKMRFIAVQFTALLTDGLWFDNARHANSMARLLAEKVRDIPQVEVIQKVEANAVFVKLPKEVISKLQEKYFFYEWNTEESEVRWMTSFDTSEEDVLSFVNLLKRFIDEESCI